MQAIDVSKLNIHGALMSEMKIHGSGMNAKYELKEQPIKYIALLERPDGFSEFKEISTGRVFRCLVMASIKSKPESLGILVGVTHKGKNYLPNEIVDFFSEEFGVKGTDFNFNPYAGR